MMNEQSRESDVGTKTYWPLWNLVVARVLEFVREPAAVFWVYVFPLLMMLALGIAFRERPIEQSIVWVEQNASSSWVMVSLEADVGVRTTLALSNECRESLRTGKSDLVVVPTSDRECTYRYDPTRPGSLLARNHVNDVLQRAAGRLDIVEVADEEFTEVGGRYIDFLVPGLIAMGLMMGGLFGVGFAIVDLRIRNLLKRFTATPMKKTDFLGAIMISRLVFMIPEVLFMLLMARIIFGVTNQGSYITVSFLIVLGAFEFAGIGLLIASRAKTLETASGLMNLVMLPMWVGSGIFFSADRFPDAAQPIIRAMPLTALVDALRKVILEGMGIAAIVPELGIVAIWTMVSFLLALVLFRWN